MTVVPHETTRSLEALGLEPGASRQQIRSAHRALVRTWHPDRFESDPELRARAEEQLKEINAAYSWLLANPPLPLKQPREPRAAPQRPPAPTWPWVLASAAVSALLLLLLPGGSGSTEQGVVDVSSPPPAEAVAAAVLGASRRKELDRLPSLEQSMVASACAYERLREDPAAHLRCIDDQLAALARSPGAPRGARASVLEQGMLESACSYERHARGPASYYACLRMHLRELAGAPAWPSLAAASAAELLAIERACVSEGRKGGPAAYRRCLGDRARSLGTGR